MRQDIIDSLPDILKNNIDTLKNTSLDTTDNTHYMTNSEFTAINFDEVAKCYKDDKYLNYMPSSNDALYIVDNSHFQQKANKKSKSYGKVLKLKKFILKDINFYSENEFKNKFISKLKN